MPTDPPAFDALGLDDRLLANLDRLGFQTPTPIQGEAIPPLLAGRDVIGQARTGSGKTAAYALPMLHRIAENTGDVRALILAPTRELALQVTDAIRDLAKGLPVRVVTIYGGAPYPPQLKALKQGVPIVVGTPGRVLDHMQRGSLELGKVELLVLDEADEMLRMGFLDAVETVIDACPPDRQVALLSATMPADIRRVADGHLHDAVELQLGDDGPNVDHIEQHWIRVPQKHKLEALVRLLRTGPPGATLVFVRTRAGCAEVADALSQQGVAADALHGDLSQAARERVVARLRSGRLRVVVATDVAARGIDVEHIDRVINLDLPDDTETYVHRIGRTARAGREGEAITFVTSSQRKRLADIARGLAVEIRKGSVPTDADIVRHRQDALLSLLTHGLEVVDLDPARAWIAQRLEEGWALDDLAAVAIARVAHLEDVPLGAPPEEAPRPEASDTPEVDPELVQGPMVEVFFSIGERHGVRPGDLVGALVNEAGVPPGPLGKITIAQNKSFVGMPEPMARDLLSRVSALEIRGRTTRMALAQGDTGPSGGRRPPKRRFQKPKRR